MSNYVPNNEERYYEVHPSQLRWAMHQLGAMPGYNVQGYARSGGMYIIVVQVPVGAPEQDWRDAPPRRRTMLDISPRMIAVLAAVALLVAVVGYAAYSGFTVPTWDEVADKLPAMPERWPWEQPQQPQGEPVVERTGFRWPWESEVVSQPQPQRNEGFRWPWEAAQDNFNDGMAQIGNVFICIGALCLLAAVLWFVGLVRGAIGK